jgi:hypothetical protein
MPLAIEVACMPDQIRGYEHKMKASNVKRLAQKSSCWSGGPPVPE